MGELVQIFVYFWWVTHIYVYLKEKLNFLCEIKGIIPLLELFEEASTKFIPNFKFMKTLITNFYSQFFIIPNNTAGKSIETLFKLD